MQEHQSFIRLISLHVFSSSLAIFLHHLTAFSRLSSANRFKKLSHLFIAHLVFICSVCFKVFICMFFRLVVMITAGDVCSGWYQNRKHLEPAAFSESETWADVQKNIKRTNRIFKTAVLLQIGPVNPDLLTFNWKVTSRFQETFLGVSASCLSSVPIQRRDLARPGIKPTTWNVCSPRSSENIVFKNRTTDTWLATCCCEEVGPHHLRMM